MRQGAHLLSGVDRPVLDQAQVVMRLRGQDRGRLLSLTHPPGHRRSARLPNPGEQRRHHHQQDTGERHRPSQARPRAALAGADTEPARVRLAHRGAEPVHRSG